MLGVYTILGDRRVWLGSAHTLILGGVSLALQVAFVLARQGSPTR